MNFQLVDEVLDRSADRIVVVKMVSRAEEYLADHFPGFPILPGVLMIETMTQAARELLAPESPDPLVLGEVKAVKFGAMVRPGEALEVTVTVKKRLPDGTFVCKGEGKVRRPATMGSSAENSDTDATAVSGRFTMRPVRRVNAQPHG